MAFLLPPLAPPKQRHGPTKRCNCCPFSGTKGFTKGPDGEWYHVGCISSVEFAPCSLCGTVINEFNGWAPFEGADLLCSTCCEYAEEEEYKAGRRWCSRRDCHRTAVERGNDKNWYCRKHTPDGD